MGPIAFNAGDIESTLTLDRSPFQRGLREARADADRFEKKKIRATIDVDSKGVEKVKADMERISKQRRGVNINVDIDKSDVAEVKRVLDDIEDNTAKTASRSGNKMARALLNPLVIQLGLMPAIAMASAAGIGLAMGAVAIGFGVAAAAALKNNNQIRDSWGTMWSDIKSEAKDLAGPLVDTFSGMAEDIYGTWSKLRPEIAQIFKDIGPLIDSVSDGVLGLAENAVPKFGDALAVSGPIMRGFDSLLRSIGTGLGDMAINMTQNATDTGRSMELLGQFISGLLAKIGSLLALFSSFWADVGPQFNRVFDMLTSAVVSFVDGGLTGLGNGLTVVLGILEVVLGVLGPVADIIGGTTGYLLAGAAAWKLLAGGVGIFAKIWNAISPSSMMGKMAGVTSGIERVANATGGFATRVSGSEKAGERLSGVMTKIGNAAVKSASYIPLIGTAIAIAGAAIDHFFPSADTLSEEFLKGGQAAEDARGKVYGLAEGYSRANPLAAFFGTTLKEVNEAMNKQLDGMTAVERAQTMQAQAQGDYDLMVKRHGENSGQAQVAAQALASAENAVEAAQRNAADATKDHTDRMIEQTNLMLGAVGAQLNYKAGLEQLEVSQKNLNDAVKEHGKGSIEARQADTQYQQGLLSVIQSVGARAKAEAEARHETNADELATQAMRGEIIRLSVAAGKNLPASLAVMTANMSDSELAAYGVERQVTKTGTVIRLLPGHKQITFPTDAPQTKVKIDQLATSVRGVPTTHYIDFYLRTIGNVPSVPKAPQTAPGLGFIGTRAGGGPVEANKPYWVGEAGLPELFFPKVDGFILNGNDSAAYNGKRTGTVKQEHTGLAPSSGSRDPGDFVAALEQALGRVLSGVRLGVDGSEWAKLVTEQNARNSRR